MSFPKLLIAALVVCSSAVADVPRLVHYQGKLRDAGGAAINATVSLRFRLYPGSTTTTPILFDETHLSVLVNNGLFGVLIGSQSSGVPDSALDPADVWLGVAVNEGPELSPRTRIATVPYSVKAKAAEQLVEPGTMNPAVQVDAAGNVGVGTATPGSSLDVKGTLRLSGSTSGHVGIQGASAAGSTTYTLPSSDGSNGEFLATNGAGTLSWGGAGGVPVVVTLTAGEAISANDPVRFGGAVGLASSLISYWKLDESSGNAVDSVGSNTLTNNNATPFVSGKINNGADMERSSLQHFSISDAAQSGLDISGDYSVSFWAKFEQLPTSAGSPFGITGKYLSTGDQRAWSVWFNEDAADQLHAYATPDGTTGNTRRQNSNGAAVVAGDVGNWVHYTVTFDISPTPTFVMYKNGSVIASSLTANGTVTSIYNNTLPFILGRHNTDSSTNFDGVLDEVGIWSRPLTSDEVTALYNGGAGVAYPFSQEGVYRANASDALHANSFIGFARSAISQGAAGEIVVGGIATGFSGLTAGRPLYLSNSNGAISTVPGTVTRRVGVALDAARLLIGN